jgi:hypothetical protein
MSGVWSWQAGPHDVSSHFIVGKDGTVWQGVDTANRAWCQSAGNREWLSIENVGFGGRGEALTAAQVDAVAGIVAWAHTVHGIPLTATDDPVSGRGLGWHGMGGTAWGGHVRCPGDAIRGQRGEILALAARKVGAPIAPAPVPAPVPPLVQVKNAAVRLSYTIGTGPILREGSQGAAVRDWQMSLAIGAGQKVAIDGAFGPATRAATVNVQRFFRIAADGIVGPQTRAVMVVALARFR